MKRRSRTKWTWTLVAVAVTLVLAAGCSKKQTVKSTEEAPPVAAAPAPEPAGAPPEAIATESVKPEAQAAPPAADTSPGTDVARAGTAEAGVAATQEQLSSFQDIHFDYDKALIRDDAKPTLMAVADYLKKNQGAKVLIEGHCDERGTAEYNMALGERRAESARSYLVSLGVPAGALSVVSFGKEKPVDAGHDEGAWARNRRAHFASK